MARPTEYKEEFIGKVKEYLALCVDEVNEYHKTRGEKSDSYDRLVRVRLPTIEGLAVFLGISKNTIYEWCKVHKEFSDVIDELRETQADRLVNSGLSGDYNPNIAKVLLTKHGYREGQDLTTNDRDLPTPIFNYVTNRNNDSDPKDSEIK